MRRAISLVITTRNNAATLEACIRSVPLADEILVLDSFSDDDTVERARILGARVVQEAFRGYGPQKQRAIDLAAHELVLLLDADEALSPELAGEMAQLLEKESIAPAYRLRREEWLYWRWPRRGTRLTDHLRLFDRRHVSMGDHPVHAAPELRGPGTAPLLRGRLRHYGHADLAGQAERINHYTTKGLEGLPESSFRSSDMRMITAPVAAFFREYILRRQFLNGWAGYIGSRMAAWHAFMRHAKRMEHQKQHHDP